MSRYLLLQVAKDKTVKLLNVDQYAAIPAERGATYRLLDAATGLVEEMVVLRKKGDALLIEAGGSNVAQLDQFYGAQQEAVYEAGHSGDGAYLISESSAVAEQTQVVWQAEGAAGAAGAASSGSISNVMAVAIGAGGLAAGYAIKKSDDSSGVVSSTAADTADEEEDVWVWDGVTDNTVVVFDLVTGQSSGHSNRTFDLDTTYTIYVRDTTNVGTGLLSGQMWSGGENLGSDDKIFLVGHGAPFRVFTSTPGWLADYQDDARSRLAAEGRRYASVGAYGTPPQYVSWYAFAYAPAVMNGDNYSQKSARAALYPYRTATVEGTKAGVGFGRTVWAPRYEQSAGGAWTRTAYLSVGAQVPLFSGVPAASFYSAIYSHIGRFGFIQFGTKGTLDSSASWAEGLGFLAGDTELFLTDMPAHVMTTQGLV